MSIPLDGTFEYVAVVPDQPGTVFPCTAQLEGPPGTDAQPTTRLVGPNPLLNVDDAGPTPNPSPRDPATQRSRLTLTAAERRLASVAKASFVLDRGVISALRAEDLLHIVRTSCGRVSISATRSGQLIFAVGALTHVPSGCDFEARIPMDLVREAEAVFRKHDPGFRFAEYPVEIRVSGEKHILYKERIDLVSFEVGVLHGHYFGTPGSDPCISVVRKGACPVVDANTSAQLLDSGTLEMVHWTDN